jgi:hypothetical protein
MDWATVFVSGSVAVLTSLGTAAVTVFGWMKLGVEKYVDQRIARDFEAYKKELDAKHHKQSLITSRLDSEWATVSKAIWKDLIAWDMQFMEFCAGPPADNPDGNMWMVERVKKLHDLLHAYMLKLAENAILFDPALTVVLAKISGFMGHATFVYGQSFFIWANGNRTTEALQKMIDAQRAYMDGEYLKQLDFLKVEATRRFRQVLGITDADDPSQEDVRALKDRLDRTVPIPDHSDFRPRINQSAAFDWFVGMPRVPSPPIEPPPPSPRPPSSA